MYKIHHSFRDESYLYNYSRRRVRIIYGDITMINMKLIYNNFFKSISVLHALILAGILSFTGCIHLDYSPYDTYNGEVLGWLAIAATPDRPVDPRVRYHYLGITTETYSLYTDACKTLVTGSAQTISSKAPYSPYFSVPTGTYWIGTSNTTGYTFSCLDLNKTLSSGLTYI